MSELKNNALNMAAHYGAVLGEFEVAATLHGLLEEIERLENLISVSNQEPEAKHDT